MGIEALTVKEEGGCPNCGGTMWLVQVDGKYFAECEDCKTLYEIE